MNFIHCQKFNVDRRMPRARKTKKGRRRRRRTRLKAKKVARKAKRKMYVCDHFILFLDHFRS
jgi:hypothetical protein